MILCVANTKAQEKDELFAHYDIGKFAVLFPVNNLPRVESP
jgi:hypothetical protein